jgi:hypothetical protein
MHGATIKIRQNNSEREESIITFDFGIKMKNGF